MNHGDYISHGCREKLVEIQFELRAGQNQDHFSGTRKPLRSDGKLATPAPTPQKGLTVANIEKRTSKDGKTSYRVKIRLKGRQPETATFKRLTDAKRWATQTEAAIREGRYFHSAAGKGKTLSDAIDRYSRDLLPNRKRQ